MKNAFESLLLALQIVSHVAYSQGTILFDTRIPGVVDARLSHPDGTGFGPEFLAQLYWSPLLDSSYLPLFPMTRFKGGAESGYVDPVLVTVPGRVAGERVPVLMRAFLDPRATCPAVLGGIFVTLGDNNSPGLLIGLNGASYIGGGPDPNCLIPEPSVLALALALPLFFVGFRQFGKARQS